MQCDSGGTRPSPDLKSHIIVKLKGRKESGRAKTNLITAFILNGAVVPLLDSC